MSDIRRVRNDLDRGKSDMSTAAAEAFQYLNAATKKEYRGWGDTASAARDRAARKAGITPAQGERLWKRWKTMASVDGDVYRALRNKYEALCEVTELAADKLEARRLGRTGNAVSESAVATPEGVRAGGGQVVEEELR
jgi:hypothetical protein